MDPDTPATIDDATPPAALVVAFATVGAAMIAVTTFLYGLILAQTANFEGHLVAVAGLVAYLAVWGWGLYLARGG